MQKREISAPYMRSLEQLKDALAKGFSWDQHNKALIKCRCAYGYTHLRVSNEDIPYMTNLTIIMLVNVHKLNVGGPHFGECHFINFQVLSSCLCTTKLFMSSYFYGLVFFSSDWFQIELKVWRWFLVSLYRGCWSLWPNHAISSLK